MAWKRVDLKRHDDFGGASGGGEPEDIWDDCADSLSKTRDSEARCGSGKRQNQKTHQEYLGKSLGRDPCKRMRTWSRSNDHHACSHDCGPTRSASAMTAREIPDKGFQCLCCVSGDFAH